MNKKPKREILSRRLQISKENVDRLRFMFAENPAKPLDRSTIINWLNERYPHPKAVKVREFAMRNMDADIIEVSIYRHQ